MKWIKKQLDKLAMWWLKPTISTLGKIVFTDGSYTLIRNVNIECEKIQVKNLGTLTTDGSRVIFSREGDTK